MRVKKFVMASAFLLLTLTMLSNGIEVKAEQPEFFFSVNMIGPTSNPVRMQFCQLMEKEVQKIGIGAELDLISWAALGPRATDAEVGTYDEGGYDICFFGMSLGTAAGHPGDSMQGVYGSGAIPPAGFNVMYWSPDAASHHMTYRVDESDDLITDITTELDLEVAKGLLNDWQKLWYDAMPNIIIYNQYEVHAVSSTLYGYDPVGYPLDSITTQWGEDSVVLAASTAGDTFNTMIATDVYDQYSAGPPTSGLFQLTPSKDTVLPEETDRATWMQDNFGTTDYLKTIPGVLTEMGTFSEDGLQYNVTMRDDVYFHDGVQADGWDVMFSQQARLTPDCGASVYSNWLVPFGYDDNGTGSEYGNYSCTVEDLDGDGFYGNISFNLITTFAPLLTDTLSGLTLFPEHILGDPTDHGFTGGVFDISKWQVAPSDWAEHSYNTGRTSDPGGLPGPIGTGPMIFKEYNAGSTTITLEKFDGVMWDNDTGAWVANATNRYYEFKDGKWDDMPDTATVIVASMDSALADMKDGLINIMDPQFTMSNILSELQADAAITPVLTPETGWQSIYMNPKFVQDGVYHLDKKGVRHAISHVVPREDIITYLMNGLGLPGFTPVPITSWGAIQESEMLTYKKTVVGTDGVITPEENATTAYDEYDLDTAFTWLDTEGYDTTLWREWASGDQDDGGTTPGFEFLAISLSFIVVALIARKRRN